MQDFEQDFEQDSEQDEKHNFKSAQNIIARFSDNSLHDYLKEEKEAKEAKKMKKNENNENINILFLYLFLLQYTIQYLFIEAIISLVHLIDFAFSALFYVSFIVFLLHIYIYCFIPM